MYKNTSGHTPDISKSLGRGQSRQNVNTSGNSYNTDVNRGTYSDESGKQTMSTSASEQFSQMPTQVLPDTTRQFAEAQSVRMDREHADTHSRTRDHSQSPAGNEDDKYFGTGTGTENEDKDEETAGPDKYYGPQSTQDIGKSVKGNDIDDSMRSSQPAVTTVPAGSQGARPKTGIGKDRKIIPLWPDTVLWQIKIKHPNGKIFEEYIVEKDDLPAIQFFVTQSYWLKEHMQKEVDKSFNVDFNREKCKVTFNISITSKMKENLMEKLKVNFTKLMKSLFVHEVRSEDFPCLENLADVLEKEAGTAEVGKTVHIYETSSTSSKNFIIVGPKAEAELWYSEFLQSFKKSFTSVSNDFMEEFANLGETDTMLFEKLNGYERICKRYKSLKIEFVSGKVKISGTRQNADSVRLCLAEIIDWPKKVKNIEIDYDSLKLKLLEMQEVRTHFEELSIDNGIHCVYSTDVANRKIMMYGLSEEVVKIGLDILNKCVVLNSYDHKHVISSSQAYIDFIEKHSGHKLMEFIDEPSERIEIVATADVMLEFSNLVKAIIQGAVQSRKISYSEKKPRPQESQSHAHKEKYVVLKPDSMFFLQNDETVRAEFTDNFPQVKVSSENEEGKMALLIGGTEKEIDVQSSNIKAYFDSFGSCIRKISTEKYKLINDNPVVQKYMTDRLLGEGLLCYWWIGHNQDSIICTKGRDDDIAKKGMTILEGSVKHDQVCSVEIITHQKCKKIKDIVGQYMNTKKVLIIGLEVGAEDFSIVSTDDIFSEFMAQVLKAAGIKSSLYSDDIHSKLGQCLLVRWEKYDYMQRYMSAMISKLESNFNVTISLKNPQIIDVKSNNDESNNEVLCISELKQILSQKVGVENTFVPDSRLVEKLKGGQSVKVLSKLETKYQCATSLLQASPEQICTYSCLDENYHVVVVLGRTSSLEVDAIVLPVNECLFPIGYSDELLKDMTEPAKANLKSNPKKYGLGDIFKYHAVSDFPFQQALLTVMTIHNQGVNKGNIKKAMQYVFKHCEKERIKSLAIPVQISEFTPAKEQAGEIIEELKLYFSNEKNTAIHELYICVLDKNEVDDVVKMINTNLCWKELDFFDWRPLKTNTSVKDESRIDVQVVIGSLVDQQVDLLVNTVGKDLNLDNGIVSRSIRKKAGEEIQLYCYGHYKNGITYGQVIETPSGSMKNCASICHGALTLWYQRSNLSLQVLRLIIWRCLTVANRHQYKSVAFPAFGTGKLNYPPRQVAETMFDAIKQFGEQYPDTSVKEVKVAVYKDKDGSREDGVVKRFKSVSERLRSPDTGDSTTHSDVLDCIVPAYYGNVFLQVMPMTEVVEGDLIVEFDKSARKAPPQKLIMDENGTVRATYTILEEASIKTILEIVKYWRLTDICIIMKSGMTGNLAKSIATIQYCIFTDPIENGCLQSVKMYVESMNDFNEVLANPPNMDKSFSTAWFGRKICTELERLQLSLRKTIDKKLRVDYIVSMAGNKEQAHQAKMEFSQHLQTLKDELKRQSLTKSQLVYCWAVRKRGASTEYEPLSDGACRAIAFAIEKGDHRVLYKEKGIEWTYDITKASCYKDNKPEIQYQLVKLSKTLQEDTEGSSVDHETQSESFDENMFSWIYAEIDCSALSNDTLSQVSQILKEHNLQITNKSHRKICVEGLSLDEFCKVNDIQTTKTGTKIKQVATSRDQSLSKTVKQKNVDESFEKIVTIKITKIEHKLLKHFMPKSRALAGNPIFRDDSLLITLLKSEIENEVEKQCETDIVFVRSLNNTEILFPNGISDKQYRDIKDSAPGNVFYDLSDDRKMLILFTGNYALLGEAKHKAEIILGLKQAGKGRRNRVFATESDFSSSRVLPKSSSEDHSLRSSDRLSKTMSSASRPLLEMTYKTAEGLLVKVYNGNILSLNVDCIVNAANENLSHGGGVAYVIASAAGYEFDRESDDYIRHNGPIAVGECCTTSAGKLQYKHVIHTVGPKWHEYPDKKRCAGLLKKAVEACFFEADINGMSSIAIPSISAGIFGVPKEVCCIEYGNAVEDYSRNHGNKTSLKEIHFIDKDMGMITMIQREFGHKFNLTMPSSSVSRPVTSTSSGSSSSGSSSRLGRSNSVPDDTATASNSQNNYVSSSTILGSVESFKKQFMVTKDLKVTVVKDDIVKMKVKTIVCPQDADCSNKGAIARAIQKISDEPYKRTVMNQKRFSKGDVRKVNASPESLPFQFVLHVIPPRYDSSADKYPYSFEKDLECSIRSIIRHCSDKSDVSSMAMPVLGIGKDGYQTPIPIFAKVFLNVLISECTKSTFDIKEIYIVTNDIPVANIIAEEFAKEKSLKVVTSFQRSRNKRDLNKEGISEVSAVAGKTFKGKIEEGDNCIICMDDFTKPRKLSCGHMFCGNCIDNCFKVKPVCPTCGAIQGIITGDQPPGKMRKCLSSLTLPGFSCQTIVIDYEIFSGFQGKDHPTPDKLFKGIKRTAYLPNTRKGKMVAELLKIAFDRKLVFTIGHSRTTGEDGVVTWNDIHHKTSTQKGHQFGYPDDGYLDRVLDELKIKGVTEADIK